MIFNYIVLGVYVLAMVGIAYYARKRSTTLNDYMFAGKGLGGWMTAFAFGTTYFSSVILVGYASSLGWQFGIAAIWIGISNAVVGGYCAWKVMARRTRVFTAALSVKTMPEFFEKRYNDSSLKLFSSIIIFLFLIPYSSSVYQGLGYLFEYVFKIDFVWCIFIIAGLTAIYLYFGGYFATAISDFLQGIIMLAGVAAMVYFVFSNEAVNFGEGVTKMTEMGLGFIPQKGNWFDLVILMCLTSFGIYGLPQSVHKFYAIKDEKAIKRGTFVSTAFCAIVGISAYLVGSVGRLYFAEKPAVVDTIVPDILIKVMPGGLLGLVVVLVLSASMSTLSSLSLAGASAFAIDFYKGFVNKDAEDKKVKNITRVMCLCFVVISAFLAVAQIQAIVAVMSLSWGTLAGCFIGPFLYGLYSKKVNKNGVWASFISTLVITLGLIIYFGLTMTDGGASLGVILKTGISKSPLIGVICMAVSMIVTPIFSNIKRGDKKENIDELFEKLKQPIE